MAISMGDILIQIRGDTKDLNTKLNQLHTDTQKNFGAILDNAKSVGMAMTAVGVGITAALGSCVKTTVEFGDKMAEVNSLGVANLEGIRDTVKDVGIAFGIDLVKGADAAYQALSNGVPEENLGEFLKQSATAAVAGVTDLKTAVDLGSSVVHAFNMDMKDVNKVFDEAFVAVKLGVTTFGELAGSIGRLSPIFAAVGLTSKEMFASIAALTTQGIETSEAVTGMRSALTNIIKPSQDAKDVAEALGIQFDVVGLKAKGLQGFLTDVITKLKENGPAAKQLADETRDLIEEEEAQIKENKEYVEQLKQQREGIRNTVAELRIQRDQMKANGQDTTAITDQINNYNAQVRQLTSSMGSYNTEQKSTKEQLKELKEKYKDLEDVSDVALVNLGKLFGDVQGLNAVLALTSEGGAKQFILDLEEMSKNGHATQEAFDRLVAASPSFAFQQLIIETQSLREDLGRALLPTLKSLADTLKPIVHDIAEWTKAHPELTKYIIGGVAAGAALNIVLGTLLFSLGPLIKAFQLGSIVFGAAKTAIGWFTGGASAAATAAGETSKALTVVGNATKAFTSATSLSSVAMRAGTLLMNPAVLAYGALAIEIGLVIKATYDLFKAKQREKESAESLSTSIDKQVAQYKKLGVAIDENAMKSMTADEKIKYLNEQKNASNEQVYKDEIKRLTGKEATTAQVNLAMIASLNNYVSAEQASAIAISGMNLEQVKSFATLKEEETKSKLESLNIAKSTADQKSQITSDYTDSEKKSYSDIASAAGESAQKTFSSFQGKFIDIQKFSDETTQRMKALSLDESGTNPKIDTSLQKTINLYDTAFSHIKQAAAETAQSVNQSLSSASPGGNFDALLGQHAEGGTVKTPLQIVGEKGPELAALPIGSRVFTADETQQMLRNANQPSNQQTSNSNTNNHFNITVNASGDAKSIARQVAEEIQRMTARTQRAYGV